MEATLDVEPLLELRAGLRVVDAGDELINPLFISSDRVSVSSKDTDESLVVVIVVTKSSCPQLR